MLESKYSGIKLSYKLKIKKSSLFVEIFRRLSNKGGPAFVESKVSLWKVPNQAQ